MTPKEMQNKLNEAVMNIQSLQKELDKLKSNLSEKPNSCYDHLLPAGYEFCAEEEAEKWVKVQMLDCEGENELGCIIELRKFGSKELYRPIRPIQYHVAVHEAVTVEHNPYTIEKHGDGWAIYKGRDLMHHGANLGQIFDEQLAYKIAMLLSDKEPEHEYPAEPSGIISIPFGMTDSEEKSFIEMRMKIMQLEHEKKRDEFIKKWKQNQTDSV